MDHRRSGWLYDRKRLIHPDDDPFGRLDSGGMYRVCDSQSGKSTPLIPGYTQAMITAESGEIQPLYH